jgi:hypothetical protein
MKRFNFFLASLVLIMFVGSVFAANLDDFNGNSLGKMWTLRDPAKKATLKVADGKLTLDLKAAADMFRKGTDAGVMLLTDPPKGDNFSIELLTNPMVKATMPPACNIGIVFFNEKDWAYTAWGPYNAGQDIRMEDCIDQDYRWRDQTLLGIDPAKVAIDKDVYLKITKTGSKLEFFAKGTASDQWISGGTDIKLGPKYTTGNYKIGIIAKSWGGSVDSTFEFDYFNVPELATTAVESAGKLVSTWADIKK